VVSKSVDDRDRLLFLDLGVRCTGSSAGRRTGLKEPLPSGVVGAVEASKLTFSSTSGNEVDKGIMVGRRSGIDSVGAGKASDGGWVRIDR